MGNDHVKVPATSQYLSIVWMATPRETLHDGTKIQNNLTHLGSLGSWPYSLLSGAVHQCTCAYRSFLSLNKDGSPGTPAILRPAFSA